MSADILKQIVATKRKEVERKRKILPLDTLKAQLKDAMPPKDFRKSVFLGEGIRIIAEIKRFSPSAGSLRENLNPSYFARLYEKNGASAISVLIDREFFKGSLQDLDEVKKAVSLPVLAKEFILDTYQILEARLWGADAILLIARVLDEKRLFKFYHLAKDLKMSCVIEIHSSEDIEKISHLPPSLIVGINNRDLTKFQVNLDITGQILNLLPSSHLIISESGIKNPEDIKLLREKGVSAFLVGEAILRSNDPAKKLRELCHGQD